MDIVELPFGYLASLLNKNLFKVYYAFFLSD
jgi:hypothetical protein